MTKTHSFHIPVMGIGFSIDTPLKVSHFGINSVISLVDDMLMEKLRKMYCGKNNLPYEEISESAEDYRAKRITSYLNLLNKLVEKKINELKNATIEKSNELKDYFAMLPDSSTLKADFLNLKSKCVNEISSWLKENLTKGSMDVNIMTKIDKDNFKDGKQLPIEYNDAHAALRGFAESDLNSSIVLSAGMNARLYSYMENFDDFYPDKNGEIKKKIILKVSDYRSAFIQGRFLAKKGLWVSEYRIESGLNCGGHAFATDGYLMGPILAEFRDNKNLLTHTINEILFQALENKNRIIPEKKLAVKFTAQGGVGTAEEHQFLIDHYKVDSVGWGTPFLLVPEVSNVDKHTLELLKNAKEEDLYLSGISPLGVPFNSLKGNTKDIEKQLKVENGKPGSSCPKKYLISNHEFTERSICTASNRYQNAKIKELDRMSLSSEDHQKKIDKIVEKSCICVGLGTAALIKNNIETTVEGDGVSICPGPNMAYFSKIMSLKEMVDHIYGRTNIITDNNRPNMFIKELRMYMDFLKTKIKETHIPMSVNNEKYFNSFINNLKDGINYYSGLFDEMKEKFSETKSSIFIDLNKCKVILEHSVLELEKLLPVKVEA